MLVDTSVLFAAVESNDANHDASRLTLARSRAVRRLSPFVLAELDHFLRSRFGPRPQRAFLGEVERGAYTLERFDRIDVGAARELIERYADLRLSLADASIVVLAHRYRTLDVATLDERHFRVLPGPGGQPFRLLPADAV